MCALRRPSLWPQIISSTEIKSAFQIQYFISDPPYHQPHIGVNARNILDPKPSPYHWNSIPIYFSTCFQILSWIQWSFVYSYSQKILSGKLIGGYILYLESIIDKLWHSIKWHSINNDSFQTWSTNYGSRWVQIQKFMNGHHSDQYFQTILQSSHHSPSLHNLASQVHNWELEARNIINRGFPGKHLFLINTRFDLLTKEEKYQVINEVKLFWDDEERGKVTIFISLHFMVTTLFICRGRLRSNGDTFINTS
jgi:hypothetical protein